MHPLPDVGISTSNSHGAFSLTCRGLCLAEPQIEITCDEYDAVKNSKGPYARIIRVDGSHEPQF